MKDRKVRDDERIDDDDPPELRVTARCRRSCVPRAARQQDTLSAHPPPKRMLRHRRRNVWEGRYVGSEGTANALDGVSIVEADMPDRSDARAACSEELLGFSTTSRGLTLPLEEAGASPSPVSHTDDVISEKRLVVVRLGDERSQCIACVQNPYWRRSSVDDGQVDEAAIRH
jgi:hypothetical protein